MKCFWLFMYCKQKLQVANHFNETVYSSKLYKHQFKDIYYLELIDFKENKVIKKYHTLKSLMRFLKYDYKEIRSAL